ncbi:MAG: serine/threonine-protein kinase [Gemmataceae bacterium]
MHALPDIPGYELLARLGGGPLADVFAARALDSGTLRAIKVVRGNGPDADAAVLLARREARALRAVKSQHVVRLRDAHVGQSPYYLVLDLLGGESLRERLTRDYALDHRTALWIARQTATGLDAVHRAGFLHGDLKPDNVQLDNGTAVLLDLGFARKPGASSDGFLLGTANYLAPELCGREPAADFAADWYAFGVTLFEMLVGRLPFATGSVAEAMERHRTEDARTALNEVADQWPPRLAHLVDTLLHPHAGSRPRGQVVLRELIALEIGALGVRRAG